MSYEKDKLDSYVTSASLSTALAPYATSASVSSAITAALAGIDLSAYVSSNSLSAAVATDVLTVRGAAAVSATLSAAAVTVAGRPVGMVLIGHTAATNVSQVSFSGSWSNFYSLALDVTAGGIASGTPQFSIYTDGGTTPTLSSLPTPTVGASARIVWNFRAYGVDNAAVKIVTGLSFTPGSSSGNTSVTATAGFVNCVKFIITATASFCVASLYGYRKT
jgi:hypothetical protein